MKFSTFLPFIATVAAWPQAERRADVRPWSPAKETDSRSPCPMMNTLANHGYLPHDGKQITVPQIVQALKDSINFNPDDSALLANAHFGRLGKTVINLADLNTHNLNEHDASNTREDFPGDTLHVSKARVNAMLADTSDSFISAASLSKTRDRVEAILPVPSNLQAQATGETAFILQVMSTVQVEVGFTPAQVRALQAPKNRVDLWLKNEQLPVSLGWKAPTKPHTLAAGGLITNEIAAGQAS